MAELLEGQRLGRYRVDGFLAEGGMGRVYRAFDTLLHRRVALKLLATRDGQARDAPGAAAIGRLLRGARAAAGRPHEREQILEAPQRANGNQKDAARLLGVSRQTLSKKLDAHSIGRPRKGR